jgi:hypothetical protein
MQWLISLETENDPIPACRLVNIFRRKGMEIGTFNLTAQPAGFSLMAVVDTPECEVEHLFNFLRRTEGIRHVAYYRHEPSAHANFVFIDSVDDPSMVPRFSRAFPESKIVFASNGKYLFEVGIQRGTHAVAPSLGEAGFLPFAQVKTSHPEMLAATAS